NLPPMHRAGDVVAPNAPQDIASAGLEESALTDLVVKLAYTVARFTPEWVAKHLHLSLALVGELLQKLALDGLVEEVMGVSRYKITHQGREQAVRLLEVCGYIGPAPVSLEMYAAMLRWQFANTPPVQPEHVSTAL